MATTLADIQSAISLDFDQNSQAPLASTDDYARRKLLINRAEKKWRNAMNGKWNDLRTTASVSVTSGVSTATLPTDLTPEGLIVSKGGYITLNGTDYKFVKVSDVPNYATTDLIVYITGEDANGYTLNIQPTPTSSYSFTVNYFSKYTAQTTGGSGQEVLVSSTDETKIPDPDYIVLEVVSQLFKVDGEGDLGMDYEKQAKELLDQMIARNNTGSIGAMNVIQSVQDINSNPVIGE